jgi:hypothetical protein
MKISHKELEGCRTSPKNWVASKQLGSGFATFGYKQALNLAICEFHKTASLKTATANLDRYVAKNFKDAKKIQLLYDRLDQYAKWFFNSGIITADYNVLLNFPVSGNWRLGGRISRVDLLNNGYRAVIFEPIEPDWKDHLRMPLIQTAIAEKYGRPAIEVRVGLQDVSTNTTAETRFGLAKRTTARAEFKAIGNKVLQLCHRQQPVAASNSWIWAHYSPTPATHPIEISRPLRNRRLHRHPRRRRCRKVTFQVFR